MICMISKGEYSDYGVQCLLERKKRITESEASEAWAYWCGVRDVAYQKQQQYWGETIEKEFPKYKGKYDNLTAEDKARWAKVCNQINKVTAPMMPDPGETMAVFLNANNIRYVEHNVGY